jgi:hypothetical protein
MQCAGMILISKRKLGNRKGLGADYGLTVFCQRWIVLDRLPSSRGGGLSCREDRLFSETDYD